MPDTSYFRLQLVVFALVTASFANIYITQPVLPVLQEEFAVDMVMVSSTISAVIFGIAISNLPFGFLSDRVPIQPIILVGAIVVASGGFICALTKDIWILIAARFLQGIFIPSMTTCLAAYLARTLPVERLNVVMGSYVAATVLGGMGGRLLGGMVHQWLHWRYSFVAAAVLILVAVFAVLRWLPKAQVKAGGEKIAVGFLALLRRRELLAIFLCATGSFAIFSSVFNYLPFRLHGPPFYFSTEMTTLLYLVYVVGIFMGPAAGSISNRFGSSNTLIGGVAILGLSLLILLLPSVTAVLAGLIGVCTGFFAIHSAAVGSLNRKLTSGQGRANALYVLFYYGGGWLGITGSGLAYEQGGWTAVVCILLVLLLIPIAAGINERRS